MKYFWILGFSLLTSNLLFAQISKLDAKGGNWDAGKLLVTITEAGLDYTGTVSSDADHTILEIDAKEDNDPYTLTISRQDNNWHPMLTLWARRTGDGSLGNGGTIMGGQSYIQLAPNAQYFFSGLVSRGGGSRVKDIPIQYEIRGLSVLIPVSSYSTTIIYTVTSP